MHIPLFLQRVDVRVETRTEDNVFVQMLLAVRYYRLPDPSESSSHTADGVPAQIAGAVSDAVEACMPTIQMDDIFEKKKEVTDLVKREVVPVMRSFGYEMLETSVIDIRMRGSRGRWHQTRATEP